MRTFLYALLPAFCLLTAGCSKPLFDLAILKEKETPLFAGKAESYQPTVQALAYSPDGKYLASCHQWMGRPDARSEFLLVPPVVKIWQMDGPGCFDSAVFHIQSDLMGTINTAFRFTPDGKELRVLSKSGLLFWNVEQQALRRSTISEPIAISHDGRTVAVVTNRDGSPVTDDSGDSISLVNSETGESRQRISPSHSEVCPWCFSIDGQRLLVQCGHPFSKHESWEIWNLPEGRLQCSLKSDNVTKWLSSFSPNGKTLAMVGVAVDTSKTTVTLWDTASGQQRATLWQNIENLRCLAFSPDGRWLAVGCGRTEQGRQSNNGKLYARLLVWDLKRNNEYAAVTDRSSWGITALDFAPDGKTIATGDGDGNIRFWEVDHLAGCIPKKEGRMLQPPANDSVEKIIPRGGSMQKRIGQEDAIRIAKTWVIENAHLTADKSLKVEAMRDEKRAGWSVLVWLLPSETGGHWSVFVSDNGIVVESHGGA